MAAVQGGRLFIMPAVREEHKLQATFQLPCLNKLYGWVGAVGGWVEWAGHRLASGQAAVIRWTAM